MVWGGLFGFFLEGGAVGFLIYLCFEVRSQNQKPGTDVSIDSQKKSGTRQGMLQTLPYPAGCG